MDSIGASVAIDKVSGRGEARGKHGRESVDMREGKQARAWRACLALLTLGFRQERFRHEIESGRFRFAAALRKRGGTAARLQDRCREAIREREALRRRPGAAWQEQGGNST